MSLLNQIATEVLDSLNDLNSENPNFCMASARHAAFAFISRLTPDVLQHVIDEQKLDSMLDRELSRLSDDRGIFSNPLDFELSTESVDKLIFEPCSQCGASFDPYKLINCGCADGGLHD